MSRREHRSRSWRLSRVLIPLLLFGMIIFCAQVLPGGWETVFGAVGVLVGGLFCLGIGLLVVIFWLLALIFAPLRPRPRGVRITKATYFARVNTLLALPVLELEHPGAVLLATSDSKTGWRVHDAAFQPAAAIWAERRNAAVPAAPRNPIVAWKKRYRQRIEHGFSGYYSGELGVGAWYGLVPLPAGQAFPPLHSSRPEAAPKLTVEARSAIVRRLVSECKENDVSPQAIIAWYSRQLTAQGWRACPPRPRLSGYDEEGVWRLADDVFLVSIYRPGSALTYRPDLPDAGRYVRIIEVQVKPREGTRWWQDTL